MWSSETARAALWEEIAGSSGMAEPERQARDVPGAPAEHGALERDRGIGCEAVVQMGREAEMTVRERIIGDHVRRIDLAVRNVADPDAGAFRGYDRVAIDEELAAWLPAEHIAVAAKGHHLDGAEHVGADP